MRIFLSFCSDHRYTFSLVSENSKLPLQWMLWSYGESKIVEKDLLLSHTSVRCWTMSSFRSKNPRRQSKPWMRVRGNLVLLQKQTFIFRFNFVSFKFLFGSFLVLVEKSLHSISTKMKIKTSGEFPKLVCRLPCINLEI